jgi:hypothetical protein
MDLSVFRSDFDGRIDIIPVSDPNIPSQAHRLAQAQMLLQISAQTPPGTYNMREVHRSLLSAAGIPDPNRFLSPEMQPQPQDPVSDVIAASKGMPISAFPGQDHQAYITVFSSFLQDPTLGQNKALQSIGPLLQAAIRDHMMMQYQETMGGFLQGATPDVMPEIMAEASQQILNANQQLGQYQSLEQQQLMLETKGLELREKDMAQSNAKDIAELSLKKQELDIRKRGQDIEAARDIGANTIRSKEADNKKDIMLQKFLLEGLGKMRDITSSQETKGFAEGGMVNFDDVIALINSYEMPRYTPSQEEINAKVAEIRNPTTDEPSMTQTDMFKIMQDNKRSQLPETPDINVSGLKADDIIALINSYEMPRYTPSQEEIDAKVAEMRNPTTAEPMVSEILPEVAEPTPTTFTETLSDLPGLPPLPREKPDFPRLSQANSNLGGMSLVDRVIWQESRNNPNAVSHVGAAGLMQIMRSTMENPGLGITPMDWEDRFDPELNKKFGMEYLEALLNRYEGDIELALIAYNAGMGRADAFIEAGRDYEPFRGYTDEAGVYHPGWADETEDYVKNIMGEQSITELPPMTELRTPPLPREKGIPPNLEDSDT